MTEAQYMFNLLIQQELYKQNIHLNNNNSPPTQTNTNITKCYQYNITLSDKSCEKIAGYLESDVEFIPETYDEKKVGCELVGTKTIELFKPISSNLDIGIIKSKDSLFIGGAGYNLDLIYNKYPTLNEFDVSKCNWTGDKNLIGNFYGCLSCSNQNDKDIINNKYMYMQYDIIDDKPVFDYLYYLGGKTCDSYGFNKINKSNIYNNTSISDTFKSIFNCCINAELDYIQKPKTDAEKKMDDETLEKLEWYNLINHNDCNIIGVTDDFNHKHMQHLYNQFNLFINDVMDYLDNNKSLYDLKTSFKKMFLTDDEKFYSHVIKSFLVPYLLKDYNSKKNIPQYIGSLYFGKINTDSKINKFLGEYYVPKDYNYLYMLDKEDTPAETFIFNNDNSYNSVLYAYKYDNEKNKFIQLVDLEFDQFQEREKNNYKYTNLMQDVDENNIIHTSNYNNYLNLLGNRKYNQVFNYIVTEPSVKEYYHKTQIYQAYKYKLKFNNFKYWHYNPEGRYNQCGTTKPADHKDDIITNNDTKFYTRMTTQSCGIEGYDIDGNKYTINDIYNQKGQNIKKIGSSDDAYSVIIAKDDVEDIPNSPFLKINDDVKYTYGITKCGYSYSECLTNISKDARMFCKNLNYIDNCTFFNEEKNALIQPYANGDYIAYLKYLYENMFDYKLPCVNHDIHYTDIGINITDNDEYISYNDYNKVFKNSDEYSNYFFDAIDKVVPYHISKVCSYDGKYILNSSMSNEIKNAIIDNTTLWCKTDVVDNDIYYPLKTVDYSTLTYIIDDRYLRVLYFTFNYFMNELIINIINDIIQLVYMYPNMYLANKLKGLYNENKANNKYYLSMENPFNNIAVFSDDSTIVPNNIIKTEFLKVYPNTINNNCIIDNNHKTKYNIDFNEYNINNNLDSMLKDMGLEYLNIESNKLSYPRLSIKNDTSALDLLYNSNKYYIVDHTSVDESTNTQTTTNNYITIDKWNTKGFIFQPDFKITEDKLMVSNYNYITTTTLPFILYHYWHPTGYTSKFEFKYSSLENNVTVWYKESDKNNVIREGVDYFSVDENKDNHQQVIRNIVNNTEFFKYTYPPSCLLPNNSKLSTLY